MSVSPIKIGVIGCGNISDVYLRNARRFDILEIVVCADLLHERAETKAREYDIPKACTTSELLDDPEIELVLNITTPQAHAEVAAAAIEAGKSVYNEKPLTINRETGRELLQMADERDVRVGCAPDTFLGGGQQTARKVLDDGWIGAPVAGTAFLMHHGHERWHPHPEFYYKKGGGPMFDMGPYYLTALVSMLGPVRRVTGSARMTFAERTITSEPQFGKTVDVEVPTHVAGILDFANGAIVTIVTSFDVWSHELPFLEIYGTEGTMSAPNPDTFGGPVRIRRGRLGELREIPLLYGYTENSRGLGLADMAHALRSGRPHRANGAMAYHVLDVMAAIHEASDTGAHVDIESDCDRPARLPLDLPTGVLDD